MHVLEDDALHLGGITFLGATLWTDLCLYGNLAMGAAFARTGMSDYRLIQLTGAGRPLDPLDTAALFQQSAAWLDEAMGAARGPVVVVTHHAPSARSLGAHWEGHPLNVAFCSDLEAHIGRHQPALWVHGHMHDAFDYTLGRTRVLCNPRGYPGERGEGFDPRLVVEIPT